MGQRVPKELELGLLESQGVAVGAEAIRQDCEGLHHFFLVILCSPACKACVLCPLQTLVQQGLQQEVICNMVSLT